MTEVGDAAKQAASNSPIKYINSLTQEQVETIAKPIQIFWATYNTTEA